MATNKELEQRIKELEARAVDKEMVKTIIAIRRLASSAAEHGVDLAESLLAQVQRTKKLEAQMNRVLAALHVAGWSIKKGEFIPESNKDGHSSISTGG